MGIIAPILDSHSTFLPLRTAPANRVVISGEARGERWQRERVGLCPCHVSTPSTHEYPHVSSQSTPCTSTPMSGVGGWSQYAADDADHLVPELARLELRKVHREEVVLSVGR